MRRDSVRLIIALCVLVSPIVSQAAAQSQASAGAPTAGTETYDFEFKKTPTPEVLKGLAEKGGWNMVISNGISGEVTATLRSVTAKSALDAILQDQGLTTVEEDGILRVMRIEEFMSEKDLPMRFTTEALKVEHVNVRVAADALRHFQSKSGTVTPQSESDLILVTDLPEKIEQMRISLRELDVPQEVSSIALEHLEPGDILEVLKGRLPKTVELFPHAATGRLIVRASATELARAEALITELDRPAEVRTFQLRHGSVKDVTAGLTQMLGDTKCEIVSDERTRTISVVASPALQQKISSFVADWDLRPAQLRIEARFIEVSTDDELSLGVDWRILDQRDSEDRIDVSVAFPGLSTSSLGSLIRVGNLSATEYEVVLDAIQNRGNAKLLAAPSVTAVDGQEARILIGTREPFTEIVTTTNGTVLQNIQYIDVGIELVVTPKITESGIVEIQVNPIVSSARRLPGVDAPVVDTIEAETSVLVANGDTTVIGGLIKEEWSEAVSQVPLLGSIPILGYAFKSRTTEKRRTELLIFITPHILAEEATDEDRLADESGLLPFSLIKE